MHATTRSSEVPGVPCGDVPHYSSQLMVSWCFQVFIIILNRRLCATILGFVQIETPLAVVTLTPLAFPNQPVVTQALRRLRSPGLVPGCGVAATQVYLNRQIPI